jgi:hypothetical protein
MMMLIRIHSHKTQQQIEKKRKSISLDLINDVFFRKRERVYDIHVLITTTNKENES